MRHDIVVLQLVIETNIENYWVHEIRGVDRLREA